MEFKQRMGISLLLVSVLVFWLDAASGFASVNDMAEDLPDDYLGTEFAWVMVLDLPDAKYYLNYPGSKLSPLTKVRVRYRSFPQKSQWTIPTNTAYEELWYKGEVPVGLRRHSEIAIPYLTNGAIIVCPGDGEADFAQRAPAIADAIVRVMVDIQFRQGVTALVLVPKEEYDYIAARLAQYKFFAAENGSIIRPVNMHMRAYPSGKDELFFLQNEP
jgi:hypothetical protein